MNGRQQGWTALTHLAIGPRKSSDAIVMVDNTADEQDGLPWVRLVYQG